MALILASSFGNVCTFGELDSNYIYFPVAAKGRVIVIIQGYLAHINRRVKFISTCYNAYCCCITFRYNERPDVNEKQKEMPVST